MVRNRNFQRNLVAAAMLIGLVATPSLAGISGASVDQSGSIERENRLLVAKAAGPDDDTSDNRKLADRPDVRTAFEAYRQAGGLAPKYRFAHAFVLTSGFTGGALAGMIEDAAPPADVAVLKAHPAAFDLACEVRPSAAKAPTKGGEASPPKVLRFSIDVPAGLWRSGSAYIGRMHIGEHGKLVTKWQIDLEHVTWGVPVYDRVSRMFDEVVTSTLASTGSGRTSVHASCRVLPYSKLFGAGR